MKQTSERPTLGLNFMLDLISLADDSNWKDKEHVRNNSYSDFSHLDLKQERYHHIQ